MIKGVGARYMRGRKCEMRKMVERIKIGMEEMDA